MTLSLFSCCWTGQVSKQCLLVSHVIQREARDTAGRCAVLCGVRGSGVFMHFFFTFICVCVCVHAVYCMHVVYTHVCPRSLEKGIECPTSSFFTYSFEAGSLTKSNDENKTSNSSVSVYCHLHPHSRSVASTCVNVSNISYSSGALMLALQVHLHSEHSPKSSMQCPCVCLTAWSVCACLCAHCTHDSHTGMIGV